MGKQTAGVHEAADSMSTPNWPSIIASWTPEERREKERKFIRRIDLRLLPILVIDLLLPVRIVLTIALDHHVHHELHCKIIG